MSYLQEALKQKERELILLKKKLRPHRPDCPAGSLIVQQSHHRPQYYLKAPGKKPGKYHREYIRKKNLPLVRALAQYDYDMDILNCIDNQLRLIQGFLSHYDASALDQIYARRSDARRELITPLLLPLEEYIKTWESDVPNRINPLPPRTPICTDRGEIVRSKSEKILADKFFHLNIPYKYECAVNLHIDDPMLPPDWIFPDFTLLNRRTRKQYFWEHDGMMGSETYASDAIHKIERYEKCGIFPGEQLILTFESESHPLDNTTVDQLIRHYLL